MQNRVCRDYILYILYIYLLFFIIMFVLSRSDMVSAEGSFQAEGGAPDLSTKEASSPQCCFLRHASIKRL